MSLSNVSAAEDVSYVFRYTKEEALAEQANLNKDCINAGGWARTYPPVKATRWGEEGWRFQWQCFVCGSEAASKLLKYEKDQCIKQCLEADDLRCIESGLGTALFPPCGKPIENNPKYPQCKYNGESSSSNSISSSSSDKNNSSSSQRGEECAGEGDVCPLSSSGGGENSLCFESYDEVRSKQDALRAACEASGGDMVISSFDWQYVPDRNKSFCISYNNCLMPEEFDGDESNCNESSNDIHDIYVRLKAQCLDAGYSHTYGIKWFSINGKYCVTGSCDGEVSNDDCSYYSPGCWSLCAEYESKYSGDVHCRPCSAIVEGRDQCLLYREVINSSTYCVYYTLNYYGGGKSSRCEMRMQDRTGYTPAPSDLLEKCEWMQWRFEQCD